MADSDDFVYFLVGGLAILAIFMLVFGANIYKFGAKEGIAAGPGVIEAVKTFSIPGFVASNILETKTSDVINKDVYSGLLFGEDKIVYHIEKTGLQDISIHFRVADTNDLGSLIITANGNVLASKHFEPGIYDIAVPAELIKNETTVEIAAESSYWKIWAPTLYMVRDASITYTSYSSDSSQFKLYLGSELNSLEFAKIDVVLTQNVGSLIVDLNGRTIWDSPVNNLQSITIDKTALQLGDNIIKFRAEKNSNFAGHATVVVIYLTQFPEQAMNQSGQVVVTAVQPLIGTTNQFYG